MKKITALVLSAIMALSMIGIVSAAEPENIDEYTQVKVFDGSYGFGDAEITVYTNDAQDKFHIYFYCFDSDQILEGTVEEGVCNVEYDLSGFMSGDCQAIWDDALASENPWTPVGGEAEAADELSEYTQVKVFDGSYGFGDAEITVYTNDAQDKFYIYFYCFDSDQILEGTVEEGACNVEYDLSGFMSGDCQAIWDDALASENPWTPVGGEVKGDTTAEEVQPVFVVNERFPLAGYQEKPRVIITTDGECDDYNSLHHILLYANDLDLAGIVYSASTYHWQGDGEHKLVEITPDYQQQQAEGLDNGEQTIYRPQEMGWIEKTITDEYGSDYEYLVQNDPVYPSPEELLAITKVGNVEFEGDVRFDTEGSDWIKACILDDDERSLFIQSWGGFNTVARALLSIYEEYGETPEWENIYNKVIGKVIIQGNGQDTTYNNYIKDIYPDLYFVGGKANGYTYFAANNVDEFAREYFNSEWLTENIKFNHGKLNEAYHLVGDGTYYDGEMELFQFGMKNEVGFTEDSMQPFDQYDWLAEGDSIHWIILIPVGLRGLENGNYGTWGGRLTLNGEAQNRSGDYTEYNFYTEQDDKAFCSKRWLPALSEDWAARSDWAVAGYNDCNHPPVVGAQELDITAAVGENVSLVGTAEDPDGDELNITWWIYKEASEYNGDKEALELSGTDTLETNFRIPEDAQTGDYFNIIMEVKDGADAPFTRYAQVIVTVES